MAARRRTTCESLDRKLIHDLPPIGDTPSNNPFPLKYDFSIAMPGPFKKETIGDVANNVYV